MMTRPNLQNQQNKSVIWDFWQRMNHADPESFGTLFRAVAHEDINWNGSQPLNQIVGIDEVVSQVCQPLTRKTAQLVREMARGLRRYNRDRDGNDLWSMSGGDQWHPNLHWYGPCGIGST